MNDRFVTIDHFCRTMLGLKTRSWFYKHAAEPDMPKRVYVGGEPRLVLSECEAYVEALKRKRAPVGPAPKRKGGRPRKVMLPSAAT